MDRETFRKHAHEIVDWIADYYKDIESYPVKSQVQPGDVLSRLPASAPEKGEPFENIMRDFTDIILPGITHWQHPSFFAYFPANSSYPSILGEMLTAALGAQCMIWQTSPAAAELEERVMQWLASITGLPAGFEGVIQDSASSSTLCAVLSARESVTGFAANERGLQRTAAPAGGVLTAYCSTETHSSIEKDIKIAGIGKENLRKVGTDGNFAMLPEELDRVLAEDKEKGFLPCIVVASVGTTGSTAVDPVRNIGEICKKHGVWLHVDAALAGSAMVIPENRWMIDGLELADSYVFNPHKWLFTNFDCSAYFVRDKGALIRTFEIMPEYLKTKEDSTVNNYRDWGVQLGRRFRALKFWFVLRTFGVEGLRRTVGGHMRWAGEFAGWVEQADNFELLAPVPLNTVCFRYLPAGLTETEEINRTNAALLEAVNATGKMYITHTKLSGKYALRLVVGQTYVERRHVKAAWELLKAAAGTLSV
jgi:aromatic-L-amino-acid/L-tryptophan decarboxylase